MPWVYTKMLINRFTGDVQAMMTNPTMMRSRMHRLEKEHLAIFGDRAKQREYSTLEPFTKMREARKGDKQNVFIQTKVGMAATLFDRMNFGET